MINDLLTMITNIPKDKILHSYFGYVILDIAIKSLSYFPINKLQIIIIALTILSILIFAKEFYDKSQPNNFFDWKDVIAGYGGALIKLILYII